MKSITSNIALEASKKVIDHNNVVKEHEKFEVYEVPESVETFEGYALLLFKDDNDFVAGAVPKNTMFIPVKINDRQGYFIDKDVAQSYS